MKMREQDKRFLTRAGIFMPISMLISIVFLIVAIVEVSYELSKNYFLYGGGSGTSGGIDNINTILQEGIASTYSDASSTTLYYIIDPYTLVDNLCESLQSLKQLDDLNVNTIIYTIAEKLQSLGGAWSVDPSMMSHSNVADVYTSTNVYGFASFGYLVLLVCMLITAAYRMNYYCKCFNESYKESMAYHRTSEWAALLFIVFSLSESITYFLLSSTRELDIQWHLLFEIKWQRLILYWSYYIPGILGVFISLKSAIIHRRYSVIEYTSVQQLEEDVKSMNSIRYT